jgi:molecular chaperone GrpE
MRPVQHDTHDTVPNDADTGPRGLRATTLHGAPEGATTNADSKAAEHLAGWQRARADYENLLRRTEHDLARAAEAAQDQLLRELLPIADYFSAAARHIPDTLKQDPWGEGILRIHQAFDGFLKAQGVSTVEAAGIPLDPLQHEAVAEVPNDQEAGTVVEVVTLGYVRNGRVLRPAKVKVST